MYRISEFAKLSRLSASTLRDYEKRHIFMPASVDRWTGYRYYDGAQLAALSKILALRELDFSLNEITNLKIHRTPVHQLIELLEKRAQDMDATSPNYMDRLERLRAHIILIKNGGVPSAENVSVKRVESIRVASVRRTVPAPEFVKNLEEMWLAVSAAIPESGPKDKFPLMVLYHSGFDNIKRRQGKLDVEVAEPVLPLFKGNGEISTYPLPMVPTMACVAHRGPISAIDGSVNRLHEWMADNQREAAGCLRRIYHRGVCDAQNPEEHITELQIPLQ